MTQKDKIKVRASTHEDIKEFYGDTMRKTVRAWSVCRGNRLLAIGGVLLFRGTAIGFSSIVENPEMSKREIWESAKSIMDNTMKLQYPVMYAVADKGKQTAPVFLNKLGFELFSQGKVGDIYRWAHHS